MFGGKGEAKKIFQIGASGEDNLPPAPILILTETDTNNLLSVYVNLKDN